MAGERDPGREIEVKHARDAAFALLAIRAPGGTICPSEVARALAAAAAERADEEWRGFMPVVHAAVDLLLAEGQVRLSWKGKALATRVGPYRIARSARD